MKTYKQVTQPFECEIVVRKSRFITNLVPITDANDAKEKLTAIRKKYSDATHNCYAYISNRLATELRFSDDCEPSGTAGLPMLEVLRRQNVLMTLAVVTRYYGGVKLGANGLVSTYSMCVEEALKKADLRKYIFSAVVKLQVDYGIAAKIEKELKACGANVLEVFYGNDVQIVFAVGADRTQQIIDKMIDRCAGKIKVEIIKKDYVDYIEDVNVVEEI